MNIFLGVKCQTYITKNKKLNFFLKLSIIFFKKKFSKKIEIIN